MHCSLWSYQSWPQWAELLGGFAPGHDRFGTCECTVLDPQHAAVMGLGGRFKITDEPCLIDQRDPDADVLVRTSEPRHDAGGKLRDGPEPQVWVKHYGQGRVFVTTLGHDEQSQNDEWFITLLHTGIRWAGRDVPDTPHNVLSLAEQQEGYELLFNGRDLSGWAGDRSHWTAENGELVGRSEDLPHNMFLYTRKEYSDFRLKCSVRIRNHNSGVQFRSRVFPENVVKGYQADIAADRYGNLYEEGGKRKRLVDSFQEKGSTVAIPDGWNDMTINAVGPRLIITVNGLPTVDYEEKDPAAQPASGVIALQLHAGPPMEVRFRDIRIKPLNAAEWK
jgi:hypothetical protein